MTADLAQEGRPAMLPGVQPTRVISLKGRIQEFGPSLEHAPAGLVYAGRINKRGKNRGGWDLEQSRFANPFSVKRYGLAESLREYRQFLRDVPDLVTEIRKHAGGIFACWCADDATADECHAGILAFVADGGRP